MNVQRLVYPHSPSDVELGLLKVTPAYKRGVIKVVLALVWFTAVYAVLVSAVIVFAIAAGFLACVLVTFKPTLITVAMGVGLAGVGIMLVIFIFKFIFMKWTPDQSDTILITEDDQPELVALVRSVAEEVKAPYPKRIVLGPEVNAAVFYESSFWSMMLPVRKNLRIGLGLVNTLTLGELKAVLAHEFGHFSQHSMRLGSYVYTVNHVIFNLLFDNKGYAEMLEVWASMNRYFAMFGKLTVEIIEVIQTILRNVYASVHKTFMHLSREMEFHADTISAYVAGSHQAISALCRIEIADVCYQALLRRYQEWSGENARPSNAFSQHLEVMHFFAHDFDLPLKDGLPQIDGSLASPLSRSRVVVQNQWASHPTTQERERHLRTLDIKLEQDDRPAWQVFTNREEVQRTVTDLMFPRIFTRKKETIIGLGSFRERLSARRQEFEMPRVFGGFYDTRSVSDLEPEALVTRMSAYPEEPLESILDSSARALVTQVAGLEQDCYLVRHIDENRHEFVSFDFEGEKYQTKEARTIASRLEGELHDKQAALKAIDERIFLFFFRKACASDRDKEFLEVANEFFKSKRKFEEVPTIVSRMAGLVQAMSQISPAQDDARTLVSQLKACEESLKPMVKAMIEGDEHRVMGNESFAALEAYSKGNLVYIVIPFDKGEPGLPWYVDEDFDQLGKAMQCLNGVVGLTVQLRQRKFLEYQANLLTTK